MRAGWPWVLALMCTGCAELRNALAPPPEAQVQQVKQEEAPVPSPKCPERIAQEAPLEAELVRSLGPRSFVPGLTLSELGVLRSPGAEVSSSFQSEVTLADGPVALVGVTRGYGAGLLLLRPEADGYCVVNAWSTWLSGELQYTLASSWTSPDGRMAILLLKMVVGPGTPAEETRWVVLGTDGWRAWIALGTPPEHQLLVPSVNLFPKGKQLYLDVKLERTSRFALGRDGHFITGR